MLTALARWAASIATSTPWLTAATIAFRVDERAGHGLMARWCRFQQRLFGVSLTVEDRNHGRYDRGPYLFVHLNQASLFESFLYPSVLPLPTRAIVNVEYALLPLVGWAYTLQGARVIVRQWPRQARATIDRAARHLAGGAAYALSIEGQRSRDGRLQPFKKGPAVMAINARATIVPFLIFGAHACLPPGAWQVRPGAIRAVLLEAIPTGGLTLDDRHRLTERLQHLAQIEMDGGQTDAASASARFGRTKL